jgi:hypothetical protein
VLAILCREAVAALEAALDIIPEVVMLPATNLPAFFFATGDIARFSLRGVNYNSAMREPS